MIIFLVFIFYWIGLFLKYSWIVLSFLSLSILIFLLIRYKNKVFLLLIIPLGLGIGVSHINIEYNKQSYTGFIFESKENYFLINCWGEKLYCYQKENDYEIGDIITIDGNKSSLNFTVLESGFDFNDFLIKKGVKHVLNINKIKTNFKNPIRLNKFRKKFLSYFNNDSSALLIKTLFQGSTNEEIIKNFNKLHIGSVISSSGFYFSIIMILIEKINSLFLKKKKAKIVSFIISLFYGIITFPKFGVIKVISYKGLKLLNENKLQNKYSSLTLISFLGLAFLCINPYYSAQLSFIIGFGISLFYILFNELFFNYKPRYRKLIYLVISYFFFLPIEIYFYNSVCILSPITKLILTPFLILFFVIGLFCLIGLPLAAVNNFISGIIKTITNFLLKINLEIYAPKFNSFTLVIYYLLLLTTLYFVLIKYKKISVNLKCIFAFIICIYFVPINHIVTSEVSFINVGQGDSCLIRDRNSTILIDTGGILTRDIANDNLIPFFKKKQIYKLDYVITTHDDYDHSGALINLYEGFKIKNYLKTTDSFPLNVNGLIIDNLNTYGNLFDDENSKSLVLSFELSGKRYLIMGDAPKEVEKLIMKDHQDLKCDILKVGHHGSKTSSYDGFIKQIQPKEAIISVGRNNYGLPNKEVINILKKYNIKIRRTDIEDTITYCNYFFR